MGTGTQDDPLTREDVLRLREEFVAGLNARLEAGASLTDLTEQDLTLDLHGMTFEYGINLAGEALTGVMRREHEDDKERGKLTNLQKAFPLLFPFSVGAEGCIWRANLQEARLWGANLQGANLERANLQEVDLSGANLQGADLVEVNLQGAHLQVTDLQEADLLEANLQGADLLGANLQGSRLWETNFQGFSLERASGKRPNTWRPPVGGSTGLVMKNTDTMQRRLLSIGS